MFRKATLRRLPPQTREFARLLNELESVHRRGKNMVEKLSRQELEARALANARERGIEGSALDKGGCRIGWCAKKESRYGGGWNKDLEEGRCPICKGQLEKQK